MAAEISVTIDIGMRGQFTVGNGEDHMTPDQARRLAQLLELAANAVEKAVEMGENDD